MIKVDLQQEYDLIYSFFKTTTEPFDRLEWDGKILNVWNNQKIIERYSFRDLKELINVRHRPGDRSSVKFLYGK